MKQLSDQSLRKWHNEPHITHEIIDLVYDLGEEEGVLGAKCARCGWIGTTNDLLDGKVRTQRLCPECGFNVWIQEAAGES